MEENKSKDNKRKITIENTKFTKPKNHATCFVYKCGNVVELVTSANKIETTNISRYRKLPNRKYVDTKTRRNQRVLHKQNETYRKLIFSCIKLQTIKTSD